MSTKHTSPTEATDEAASTSVPWYRHLAGALFLTTLLAIAVPSCLIAFDTRPFDPYHPMFQHAKTFKRMDLSSKGFDPTEINKMMARTCRLLEPELKVQCGNDAYMMLHRAPYYARDTSDNYIIKVQKEIASDLIPRRYESDLRCLDVVLNELGMKNNYHTFWQHCTEWD